MKSTPQLEFDTRTKTVPLTWSFTSQPFSSNAAPPVVLLPSAELYPHTPAYSSPPITSVSMKRSPGLHNLNILTRLAFAGSSELDHGLPPWESSGKPRTPTPSAIARTPRSDEGCSSPELPDSPESSYGTDCAMSEDDESYIVRGSPCAAKSARTDFAMRSLGPLPSVQQRRGRISSLEQRSQKPVECWRGMCDGAEPGLGLTF